MKSLHTAPEEPGNAAWSPGCDWDIAGGGSCNGIDDCGGEVEFDPYAIACGIQAYGKKREVRPVSNCAIDASTIGALTPPVYDPCAPKVYDPPARFPFIASPCTKKGAGWENMYSVTVSTCGLKDVDNESEGNVYGPAPDNACIMGTSQDGNGNYIMEGTSIRNGEPVSAAAPREAKCTMEAAHTGPAQHSDSSYGGGNNDLHGSGSLSLPFMFNGTACGYEADEEHSERSDRECDEDSENDGGEMDCSHNNGLLEIEAEEVDNVAAQAEDDAIAAESSHSEESIGSNSTLWQSEGTNDNPNDEDYDPDIETDPPTEDDIGVPIMVIGEDGEAEEVVPA